MAGLYRRGNTYYAIYYVGGKKHRKSLETDEPRMAKAKLRELESALDGGNDAPFPTKTPIPEILECFIDYMLSKRDARSVNRDVSPLRIMFGEVCPSLQIKNRKVAEQIKNNDRAKGKSKSGLKPIEANSFECLTTGVLSGWLTEYVKLASPALKTMNRYREILQKMFSWAINIHGIRFPSGNNPAAGIERWREGAPIIEYMTRDEIEEQLQLLASDLKLQTIVATYIYAGLRREEALWLQRKDVDLKANLIHVRAKVVGSQEWEPKNQKNRSVPISKQLRAYLVEYLSEEGRDDDAWLFPAPEGGCWDPDNFSTRTLAAANERHGVAWNCKIYRHTFGSHLAMRDVSMFKISKLMGNSVAICERYYAALSPQSLADSVDFDATTAEPEAKVIEPTTGGRPKLRLVINRP